jgi:hypothetical protein
MLDNIRNRMKSDYAAKTPTEKIGIDWAAHPYYDEAEEDTGGFWNDGTAFRQAFDRLDASVITELAVGHGRHVPFYMDRAKEITLVDINQTNIDFCRKRFESVRAGGGIRP